MGKIDDESLKEELETWKNYIVTSEMKKGRNQVFNFPRDIRDAHTLNQKLDTVFEKLKSAAKLNVAPCFLLKNVEDGICQFYYAHENNTSMERSKLVATKEDLETISNVMSSAGFIEACTNK